VRLERYRPERCLAFAALIVSAVLLATGAVEAQGPGMRGTPDRGGAAGPGATPEAPPSYGDATTPGSSLVRASGPEESLRWEPRSDDGDDPAVRVFLELLGGLTGYAMGGLLGALVGCPVWMGLGQLVSASIHPSYACLLGGVSGGVFGAGLGIAGAIERVGALRGADGSYWASFGGQGIGVGLSLALIPAFAEVPGGGGGLILAAVLLPVVGGVVGYELSIGGEGSQAGGGWAALTVAAEPAGRGGVVGLAGAW